MRFQCICWASDIISGIMCALVMIDMLFLDFFPSPYEKTIDVFPINHWRFYSSFQQDYTQRVKTEQREVSKIKCCPIYSEKN